MMTNPTGRVTQGQFSFLPDLSDAEIGLQMIVAPGGQSTTNTALLTLADGMLVFTQSRA